jgi:uncharacterized membrane protein
MALKYYLPIFSLFVICFSILIPGIQFFFNIDETNLQWFEDLMARSCHQGNVRSLSLFSIPLVICSRCLGIYIGTLFGFLTTRKICFGWIKFSFALVCITLGLFEKYMELIGLLSYNNALGLFSGVLLGFGLIYSINLVSNVRLTKEKSP